MRYCREFCKNFFYRNAINIGLPILISKEASQNIKNGSIVEIDLSTGLIRDLNSNKEYKAEPYPAFLQEIIEAGGLIEKKLKGRLINLPSIAVIPGDGIGPEVVNEGLKIFNYFNNEYNLNFKFEEFNLGAKRYLKNGGN